MKEDQWRIKHLIFGFFVGAIAFYILLSLPYISNESACMLAIFNFLFVSLTFPLNGTLAKKLSLLLVGNFVGVLWNQLFSLFAYAIVYQFGEIFNALYVILSPFVNLVWLVSFWSVGLTFLADSETKKPVSKIDN